MTEHMLQDRQSEKGFTLVELAVVMIIIGLLIGGILKGQELIANAELAATVSQIKGVDGATSTFRDKYNAFPGDMRNASTRLPATACGGAACNDGDGNGRLDSVPLTAPAANEGADFFPHLAAADLIGGISVDGSGTFGDIYLEAKIDGGYHPGYWTGGALGDGTPPVGHYLTIMSTTAGPAGDAMTPNQAQRIDTKLDDGATGSGSVVGDGAGCDDGTGAYDEANQAQVCDLVVRFQS
jgi:prepilin-type N-terminal cleavage/methylation domain-containing protein